MFRKIRDFYNTKIDYKMLYFLNPKLDTTKNYYETKSIYQKNANYVSEQGKWFKKLKNVYEYLLLNDLDFEKILNYSVKEFETDVNENAKLKIINNFKNLKNNDIIYLATCFLREIIFNKPLNKYSDELAILIFNAIIKKAGFVPIIFVNDYRAFIRRIIYKKITIYSLIDVLASYEDLSIKYDKKYDPLSKEDIVKIIKNNEKVLKQKYDVKKIWLYGSFVRNEANEFSDIDLYVDFFSNKTEEELIEMQEYFVKLLKRDIDMLVENKEYKNFSNNALKEREVIFDDSKQ